MNAYRLNIELLRSQIHMISLSESKKLFYLLYNALSMPDCPVLSKLSHPRIGKFDWLREG